eukprot:TRINITY_DN31668_c0_g2_i1.p1 TRINITY_DN31668_c0_g2~~TRINITY_DN31668_c0_g2_i1.p1  ORF type:complete len:393 (-),score=-15.00 TRINITY_DN31668_c0_g2_i1:324-1502(-)
MAWKRRDEYQRPYQGKNMKPSGGSRYANKRHDIVRGPPSHGVQEFEQEMPLNRVDLSVTSSRNLESFVAHVTPRVKLQFLPKEAEVNLTRTRAGDGAIEGACFSLGDLWDSLEEWSAYGAGVPLQLANGTSATQYYVPSISGLQLYSRKAVSPLTDSREHATNGFWREEKGDTHDSLTLNGLYGASHLHEPLGDAPSPTTWDACHDCNGGQLLMEYFERAPPHMRLPLFSKVLDLEKDYTFLRSLRSHELHPQSWIAIAWYPLYKIPAGLGSRDLCASFLTFHSLSSRHSSQGLCSRCSDQYWISPTSLPQNSNFRPQKLPGTLDLWSDSQSPKTQFTPLPPFGFSGYKARGNMWSDRWIIQGLEMAADAWLKQIDANLPDYSFFSVQQYVH